MKANPVRGIKLGFANSVLLVVVLAINHLLRREKIPTDELVSSAVLAFIVFGLINTFTDKIGSHFGES